MGKTKMGHYKKLDWTIMDWLCTEESLYIRVEHKGSPTW